MTSFETVDAETVLSGRTDWIGAEEAATLARHSLDCIETEFPHYVGSVDSPEGPPRPRDQHPIFYGCFDWHSAVHSHWSLLRQVRLFEDHPDAPEILRRFDERFTAENVEREVAYFEENPPFEKPYGWAWLLRLAAELHLWEDDHGEEWAAVLRPLETRIVDLVRTTFLTQDRPFRVGTHGNSAFALSGVLDYARVTGNETLEAVAVDRAREYFLDDREYPVAYEPLGWDFLSPALVEADLMRRVLPPPEFSSWFEDFFPHVTESPHDVILDPVAVEEGTDGGVELHLIGLNVSKAWCLAAIDDALEGDQHAFEESARRHVDRGLERAFTDDYAGSHWLSTFVLYLVSRNEGGIAPT